MSTDPFHQMVSVLFPLDRALSPGAVNRVMKSLGATLHYDVYGFDRDDEHPIWQSGSYVYVSLLREGKEVNAQDDCDAIELRYPLATVSSEYVSRFVDVVNKLESQLAVKPRIGGHVVNGDLVASHCEALVTELMQEWGEEPGSKQMRVLIETYA